MPEVMKIEETQRKRRGHAFLPPKAILSKIPATRATESQPDADKIIYVHYFTAAGDWYVAELDDDGYAYGYTKLAAHPEGAEWGYFDLKELETIRTKGMFAGHQIANLLIVERDMHWKPVRFGDIKEVK